MIICDRNSALHCNAITALDVMPTQSPSSSHCIPTEEWSIAGSQTDQLRASQHCQVAGEFVLQGGSGLRNFCPNNLLTVFLDEETGCCIVKVNVNAVNSKWGTWK